MLAAFITRGGNAMSRTVLLADLPRLLDEIVSSAFEEAKEFRLVRDRRSGSGSNLAEAALAVGADVIVVARDGPGDLDSIDRHLAGLVGLSILALAPAGDDACLYFCRCESTFLPDVSSSSLLRALLASTDQARPRAT